METIYRVKWLQFTTINTTFSKSKHFNNSNSSSSSRNYTAFSNKSSTLIRNRNRNSTIVSVLNSPSSASVQVEDDVLEEFFRDRQLNGDLITKYSDILLQGRAISLSDSQPDTLGDYSPATEEMMVDEPEGGFLKLTKTQDWLLGETSAPINRKPTNKEIQDDREKRRQLGLLRYEALKSELVFVTLGVGAACTAYCLFIFSAQAAVSYAAGVGFSYLYLRLLYQHVDKLSRDSIPLIFRQRKPKKIGIRSEDLQESMEKTIKGSGIALSSVRLVLPAAIYGLWVLLHRNLPSDLFDFQIVPAMFGLFAYKAAALIQVYRDNEHLELEWPDDI